MGMMNRFVRFGHTLNALDLNGDGVDDIMLLMGGYAPIPSNDMWMSEDGVTWMYTHLLTYTIFVMNLV
jgi:hypothetical protein